jgi:membrane associated rhomboid family serine protease
VNDNDEAAASAFPSASPATPAPAVQPGLVPVNPHTGLTAIGPVPERKVRDWALVLQSMALQHAVRWTFNGWVLLVRDEDYVRASTSIDRYEAENRDWPPPKARERPRHAASIVAPLLFAALAAFFMITGPVALDHAGWFRRGRAVSDLVLGAEPWRAVTALTLHADATHVLGNVISGSIFAAAVQRRLGPGGTALAIVASGTLGNVANAIFHHTMGRGGHASIGASTAVFGAVGLLAATQLGVDQQHAAGKRRPLQEWVAPIIGGLALLGALGASPESDLGAHLFGFLSGVLLGIGAAFVLVKTRPSPRPWLQMGLGAAAIAIVLVAWRLAVPWRLALPI